MVEQLEHWRQTLGPLGYAGALLGAGFVVGILIGLALPKSRPRDVSLAPPPSPPVDEPSTEVTSKGTSSDKRRNPRRPGRSVEVFVTTSDQLGEPCKGVVLNRSVGGLGLLVGDEYPIGSTIGVLPVTASKLTPWVEVEVKSCRRNGEDWELGVQFLKMPPYSTMVLFG